MTKFNPIPEGHNIVLIDSRMLRHAERLIFGCQSCTPKYSNIPFDTVLDSITGNNPAFTDYILSEAAKCPRCKRPILENTLVELAA